jgi:hypothetical protein
LTRQQQAYRDLRIYRLRIDSGLCLASGLRFAVVTSGAMRTPDAERGKLMSQYVVCVN